MADVRVLVADIDGRNGIGPRFAVEHQRRTADDGLGLVRIRRDDNGSSRVGDAAVLADGTGVDRRGRVLADVVDLHTGVEFLTGAGKGDAGVVHLGVVAPQDGHRVQVGRVGTEGTGDPLHRAVLTDGDTLGVEVVHVLRPVLDGRVTHLGIVTDEDLDAARVEVRDAVLRSGAAFDEVELRSVVDDDEGVFELTGARRVQTEVGLQRDLDVDSRRDVDEGTAGPDGAVQGGKGMLTRQDQFHEVVLDHIAIGTVQSTLDVGVDDALGRNFRTDVVVNELGVILGADTGEGLPLRFGDTEAFKRILDVFRNVFPLAGHAGLGLDVSDDVVEVQAVDGRAPRRHLGMVEDVEALQTEVPHPFRVVLFFGDLQNDIFRQTGIDSVKIDLLISEVIEIALYVLYERFLFCHYMLPLCLFCLLGFDVLLKAFGEDLIDEFLAAALDDLSVDEDVGMSDIECLEDGRVMGDDEERLALLLLELLDALGDDADGVDVQTGVGLVEDGEVRVKDEELKDLGLFLFTAGETDVEVAVCIIFRNGQDVRDLLDLFAEVPQFDALARSHLDGVAHEVGDGDAGDFDGVLERHEQARLGALVRGLLEQVEVAVLDGAFGHFIGRVAHDGIAEGGFTGTVRAHEDMGLARVDDKVDAVQDFFFADARFEAFDG